MELTKLGRVIKINAGDIMTCTSQFCVWASSSVDVGLLVRSNVNLICVTDRQTIYTPNIQTNKSQIIIICYAVGIISRGECHTFLYRGNPSTWESRDLLHPNKVCVLRKQFHVWNFPGKFWKMQCSYAQIYTNKII